MIMRCGDNGGDLDGVSPINGAECASDHCILTSGCVGMIISIEFIVSLPFCARNLARDSIGISDIRYAKHGQYGAHMGELWGLL